VGGLAAGGGDAVAAADLEDAVLGVDVQLVDDRAQAFGHAGMVEPVARVGGRLFRMNG
jgi:hypothetical protein